MKNTFNSLHDVMTYKTWNINIDLKRKKVLYEMNCYGNHTLNKVIDELNQLDNIDNKFHKTIFITLGKLEHYFTSPTYKEDLQKVFEERIFGKYPIYTTKEGSVKVYKTPKSVIKGEGEELKPELILVTKAMIQEIIDRKLERAKISRFYRDLLKYDYVPTVKLKYYKIENLEESVKHRLEFSEALIMIHKGHEVETLKKYFKIPSGLTNLNYYDNGGKGRLTYEIIHKLEAVGFKIDKESKVYKEIVSTKIFNGLGDSLTA